jgi:hypothetical protein
MDAYGFPLFLGKTSPRHGSPSHFTRRFMAL